MIDYHDLHLKADILLWADVFEKFINTCLEYYGLDPCHFFSSRGLIWDAMPKMTEIKVEVISDIDVYLLKKEWEEAFLTFLKDLVTQLINTCNLMMIKNE